jgi:putative heme-binding domain-containing protein
VLKAHPKAITQVESALIASKGTVTFVDLVSRYNRRDLISHLLDMVESDPEKETGIRAVGQIIAFQQWDPIWKALADPNRSTPYIKALAYINNQHSKNYLTAVVTNESQPEATRLRAIAAMGQSSTPARELMALVEQNKLPKEFLAPAIRALTLSPGPDTRMYAAEKSDLLVPVESRWPLKKLLVTTPDITKGFAAFQKGGCIKCHKIGDQGQDFGPALSAIGARLTSEQLFLSILKPSETISLGYESISVVTDEGILYTGFVTTETKETLTLRIPGGLQKMIPQQHIDILKRSNTSLMPVGIDAVLLPQELVNLVGWLKTQQAVKPKE